MLAQEVQRAVAQKLARAVVLVAVLAQALAEVRGLAQQTQLLYHLNTNQSLLLHLKLVHTYHKQHKGLALLHRR